MVLWQHFIFVSLLKLCSWIMKLIIEAMFTFLLSDIWSVLPIGMLCSICR